MRLRKPATPLRTALLYALFGGAWILLSDDALYHMLGDPAKITQWQTYKGWIFVAASALLIHAGLRRELREQARTEAALRDSISRYRSLFENSPVALLEMDFSGLREHQQLLRAAGIDDLQAYFLEHPEEVSKCLSLIRVLDLNRAALALHKAKDERELLGAWMQLLHGEPSHALFRQMCVMAAEEAVSDLEGTLHTLAGEERMVVLHSVVSPGHERTFDRVHVSILDVTERRKIEDELRQRQADLARAGRIGALGELGASLAHELNQPLAAILSNAQAAQRFLNREPPDLAEVRQALGDIERDDRRADRVIRQLRNFIRREEIHRQPVDLNEACREVMNLVKAEAARRHVGFLARLAPDLPRLQGDPTALQQVLLNLVLNALEAAARSPRGTRLVLVSTAREDSGAFVATVRDAGPEVAPEMVARLFEPFFTTKPDGLGLGLSLSRSLIEAHGGTIWASPNPEGGMTFGFRLPSGGEGRP